MNDRFLFFSIGGIVAFLLALGLLFVGVLPAARTLRALTGERQGARITLETTKREFARLQEAVAKLAGLGEREARLQSILPASDDIPNVIHSLEIMANESGMVLERVEPSGADTLRDRGRGEGVKTLSFGLTLRGSYPALKSFLERLESNLRLADLLALSFVTSGENSPTAAYQYTARIRLYSAPQ